MKALLQGVYFLLDGKECVYIGESSDIYRRISEHRNHRGKGCKKDFSDFEFIEIDDEKKRIDLEYKLINLFKPKYNMEAGMFGKNCPQKNNEINTNSFALHSAETVEALEIYGKSLSNGDVDAILGFPHGTTYRMICDQTIPQEYLVRDPLSGIFRNQGPRVSVEFVMSLYRKLENQKKQV